MASGRCSFSSGSHPGASTALRLIESGELTTSVGDVLPLSAARVAHEMLAGKPHKRGKIVLTVDTSQSIQ